VEDGQMKEKREVAEYYRQNFNCKEVMLDALTKGFLSIVSVSPALIRLKPKLDLITLFER
jgi:hypothetical protein